MAQTRKQHHCRSCGSPMKGHGRGLCDNHSPPRHVSVDAGPKPVMPGAFDRSRPSDISLLSRLGPKVEARTDTFIIDDNLEPHHRESGFGDFITDNSHSQVGGGGCSPRTRYDYNMDHSLAHQSNFASSVYSMSSLSQAPLTDLLEASGATPLASIFEISPEHVPFIESVAVEHGLHVGIMKQRPGETRLPLAEGSSVWLVMGRSAPAVTRLLDSSTRGLGRSGSKFFTISSRQQLQTLVNEIKKSRKGGCGAFLQLVVAGALGGVAMYYALSRI